MKKPPDNPILTLVNTAQPVNAKGEPDRWANRREGDFSILNGRIYFMRKGRDTKNSNGNDAPQINEIPTPLTDNFVSLIAEQIILDDGAKQENAFLIEGKHKNGQALPALTIPTTQYQAMQWPLRHWGARAIVEADQATPRRLANAILKLSGNIPITTVYQHTGWRKIEGEFHYLSGTGAINAEGLNSKIRIELGEGHMQRYSLPEPPTNPARLAANLFDLMWIAPDNPAVGVSLFCCVVRSVLGECLPIDFSLFLAGQSGSQKSELAALALACFGDFNARTFPANFTDTISDLEFKSHQVKDALLVVDDFAPGVNVVEANKAHVTLERLGRGAGNQGGRGRRNADMTGKASYYPRCMLVITGEEIGKGASLLGRMLIIEMKRGDVELPFLSSMQLMARRGELAAIMAAFVQWLATRISDMKKTFPDKVRDIRYQALQKGFATSHPRAADIYASLYAAADLYMEFSKSVGAINSHQAKKRMNEIETALQSAIQAQSQFQKQTDEVERFIALLRGCFSAGECHVSDYLNQGPPKKHPFVWGWRSSTEQHYIPKASDTSNAEIESVQNPLLSDLAGRGQLIGWIKYAKEDEAVLWLEPEAVFKVLQRFAAAQNDPILIQKSTLWKRLLERGILIESEPDSKSGRKRPDVKKTIAGKRVRALVFDAKLITETDG
jgi:hypothetical protein